MLLVRSYTVSLEPLGLLSPLMNKTKCWFSWNTFFMPLICASLFSPLSRSNDTLSTGNAMGIPRIWIWNEYAWQWHLHCFQSMYAEHGFLEKHCQNANINTSRWSESRCRQDSFTKCFLQHWCFWCRFRSHSSWPVVMGLSARDEWLAAGKVKTPSLV